MAKKKREIIDFNYCTYGQPGNQITEIVARCDDQTWWKIQVDSKHDQTRQWKRLEIPLIPQEEK